MTETKFLKPALFLTRLSIFYFLLPWQVMRFTNPEQASKIAQKYYHVDGINESTAPVIGAVWLVLLALFVVGFKKAYTYGLVFVLHTGAIFVALPAYTWGTSGFNQLFLAAIPTAAAMGLLWILRKEDTLLSLGGKLG